MTARNKLLTFLSTNADMLTPSQAARVEAMREPAGPVRRVGCGRGLGLGAESGFFRKFQKGDTVFHRPTGETWSLIADEKDGWVTPGGWPPSQGRAEDCKLVDSQRQAEDESVRQPSPNTQGLPRDCGENLKS